MKYNHCVLFFNFQNLTDSLQMNYGGTKLTEGNKNVIENDNRKPKVKPSPVGFGRASEG